MEGSLNRLVNTSKHILRLLFDKNLHVNEIIRQTSPDRSYIISTVKTLEREGLIAQNKRTKKGKEIVKQLTELGREIAEIIKSIQLCYESCDGLKREARKHPLDFTLIKKSPDSYLVHLQNMEPEGKNRIGIAILDHAVADCVRDFVIFKYLSLSRKYNIKKTTNHILEQIISDATRRQMDAIMKGIAWTADPSELIADFGEHATKIANLPEKMWRYGLLSNKFSGKEKAKEALLSVLPMLKSERESILQGIGRVDALTELEKQIRQLNLKLSLEEGKPYPKEDPSERELDALYEKIRKVLS